MSPSESDLRAALHDGEDRGGLNVDHLIVHAQVAVAQRRQRLLSGAAIVAVVLGTGTGIGYLAGHGSTESAGSSNAGAGAALAPSGGSYTRGAAAPQQGTRNDVEHSAAQASFPQYALPGGGGLSQFGANGPLFSKPVASVVVCSYGTATRPRRLVLGGQDAKDLATSLENAPTNPLKTVCNPPTVHDFAVVGVAPNGTRTGVVTAELSDPPCAGRVTNGTAVRYGWAPPPDLLDRLLKLTE
jgi:hypothetical protein